MEYVIEMLHITKEFPGIIANDDITLQLKKGEIHALLGENGAGKSTLMSVLFGLYQAEKGEILKNGKPVKINNPNAASDLGIGMVHQHFKLVEVFTVLENIILGVEPNTAGFLKKDVARKKLVDISVRYGLKVDPDAYIEDISVGMQQRVEILKMLYRENEILIFDEPTAVLTPQEIIELMAIMRNLTKEGKSILFITHKLNEIMAVADRCTVLRKGKYIGTVEISETSKEELSRMMVGRDVSFEVEKAPRKAGEEVLRVEKLTVPSKIHKNNAVKNISFDVKRGEIVCIAGIDGNGQSELVYALTGLERLAPAVTPFKKSDESIKRREEIKKLPLKEKPAAYSKYFLDSFVETVKSSAEFIAVTAKAFFYKTVLLFKKDAEFDRNINVQGKITVCGKDITQSSIRARSRAGMSHIPEDRHKFGLVLDYTLEQNLVLQQYWKPEFEKAGFIKFKPVRKYAEKLISAYDIRSGQGPVTQARSMSGGNQQKAIIAREIDKDPELLVAVQPTRGLDVGAIEYIHKQLVAQRDAGRAVLLISFELEEVLNVSDRILVMYNGEITGELDPKKTTTEEIGLYMSGARRSAL